MNSFKDILEKGLAGTGFNLSEQEKEEVWLSIESTLKTARPKPVVKRLPARVVYFSLAAAAVIVAGIFILRPTNTTGSYSGSGDGVVAQTPFQPETSQPIEKTTSASDRNGATISVHQVTTQGNNRIAKAVSSAKPGSELNASPATEADSALGTAPSTKQPADNISSYTDPEPSQADSQNKTDAAPDQKPQNLNDYTGGQTASGEKDKAPKKRIKSYEVGGYSKPHSYGNRRFALAASSNFSNRSKSALYDNNAVMSVASTAGYTLSSNAPVIEQISKASYSLPLNFALKLNYRISDRITVGTGVSYTYLHSKYDGIISYRAYNIKQDIHYIGIPVNVYLNLGNISKLDFYINAGGNIEKGVGLRYEMTTRSGLSKTINSHVSGVQFSVNGGVGMEYRFSKSMGIYIEPNAVYYFNSKTPGSIRTDQPLQVEAEVGVRFHIK